MADDQNENNGLPPIPDPIGDDQSESDQTNQPADEATKGPARRGRPRAQAPEEPVSQADAIANRQRRAAQELAEAGRSGHMHDETVPGGRYVVGGQVLNADGEPVNK